MESTQNSGAIAIAATRPIVIGFLARAGNGKSTAAAHAAETWGAKRASFAGPVKELSKLAYDFSDEQLYGTQAQKEALDPRVGISPRTGMIRIGDGARHVIGQRVWIDACFNGILADWYEKKTPSGIYVIEDVRYQNEVDAISSGCDGRFVGAVFKLVYENAPQSAYADAASERSVDEVLPGRLAGTIRHRKSDGASDLKQKVERSVGHFLKDTAHRMAEEQEG